MEYRVRPERTVELLADTLARLHAVELSDDERAGASALPMLAERSARRTVQVGSPGPSAHRRTPTSATTASCRSSAAAPPLPTARSGTPVLTHGSPTLANLRCANGSAVGLVAWSGAAVADRYRDLAVAARSVAVDLAPILVPVFFDRYGTTSPDAVLLDWYSLVAELWPGADSDG